MKQRVFRPVEDASAAAPVTSKPARVNRLAVKMPLPEFSNAPVTTPAYESNAKADATVEAQESASGMQLQFIDARLVDQNAHPPRQIYSDDAIKSMAETIQRDGQRDPIHVIRHPSRRGHFIIGDGWTRVQAIRSYEINNCQVLARIHDGLTEEQASWLGYGQNENRSQHTDFDRAMFYQGWHKSGLAWEEIAKRTGLSKTLLSFYASYEKLPVELLTTARNFPEKITATVAQQLVRAVELSDEVKAGLLVSRFISGDMPQRWLKDEVIKLSSAKKPRTHKPAVNFQQRIGSTGAYKQRTDGHIELTATIATDRAEEFNARLVALVNEYAVQAGQEGQGGEETGK